MIRLLALHPKVAEKALAWGAYLLGPQMTVSGREREIVIGRVSARCGSEYEWGIHVAAFSSAAGLDPEAVKAIAASSGELLVGLTSRDALLVRFVDELHWTSTVSDTLCDELARAWTSEQLLELLLLAGWYRAISYLCNATKLPLESWAARWSQDSASD